MPPPPPPALFLPLLLPLLVASYSETWNVGKYFDLEGNFDEWGLGEAAQKLVTKLEKRVRDKKKKDRKDK